MVYIEQSHLMVVKSVLEHLCGSHVRKTLAIVLGFFSILKRSIFSSHILPVIHKKGMSIVQHSMYTKSFIKAKEGSLLSCVLLKPTYLKKAKMINLPLVGRAKS